MSHGLCVCVCIAQRTTSGFIPWKLSLPVVFVFVFNVYVYVPCVCKSPQQSKEGIRFHRTGIKGDCELLCGCCEPNPGPLGEHQELVTAEPSLQLHLVICDTGSVTDLELMD